jgi:hypothetical protein
MNNKTALHLALAAALPASAVTLNPDGTGQALIYPYYTAQSTGNDAFNAFNTYISVVNHTADAKAVRLRFREGRLGKSVLDMNVYLSPNDVWTGAVVPFGTGTRLVSTDSSCTEPRFAIELAPGSPPFIDFRNDAFSGSNDDGAGAGLDRTREGFVEIIEMATLTGASATAVTHNSSGVPSNCGAVAGWSPTVAAPSGGLSGTLTLINVANGTDFDVNAEALDALATRPFFRLPGDPYPDFNAAEIDAVSIVQGSAATYRSTWTRPVDAVSAVLMRDRATAEYVLDSATASLTDMVMTFPTRSFYVTPSSVTAPFNASPQWSANCATSGSSRFGEALTLRFFNREEASAFASGIDPGEGLPIPPRPAACAAASVSTIRNLSLAHMPRDVGATPALGSITGGLAGEGIAAGPAIFVTPNTRFSNGWIDFRMPSNARMVSTAQSSRVVHASGTQFLSAHTFLGLPFVGFSARVFRNGTLRCDAGACQGNYGGAFPFKYRRNVAP